MRVTETTWSLYHLADVVARVRSWITCYWKFGFAIAIRGITPREPTLPGNRLARFSPIAASPCLVAQRLPTILEFVPVCAWILALLGKVFSPQRDRSNVESRNTSNFTGSLPCLGCIYAI